MPDKLEVLPGPGLVARFAEVAVWAGPQATAALQAHLVSEAQRAAQGPSAGEQLANSMIAVLQRGDPEPQSPFAIIGPGATGLTLFLHGPVQAWDSGRWLAPQPVPGWMVTTIGRPWPLIVLPYGAPPPPQSQQGNPFDLVTGAVPGAGFILLRPPSSPAQPDPAQARSGLGQDFGSSSPVGGPPLGGGASPGGGATPDYGPPPSSGGPGYGAPPGFGGPPGARPGFAAPPAPGAAPGTQLAPDLGAPAGPGPGASASAGPSRTSAPAPAPDLVTAPGAAPAPLGPSAAPGTFAPSQAPAPLGPSAAPGTFAPSPVPVPAAPASASGGAIDLRFLSSPLASPLPLASALPAHANRPEVSGMPCPRGHLNHPRATACARCGTTFPIGSSPTTGTRPPVGILLADDGSIWLVDGGCLIGTDPGAPSSDAVQAITMRAGPNHTMAPVQAEIQVRDWTAYLVDRGAEGGTCIQGPAVEGWSQLGRNEQRELTSGSHLSCGGRVLTYLSAWPA